MDYSRKGVCNLRCQLPMMERILMDMAHDYESGRRHLLDAIRVNAQRGATYAAVTGGKSRSLTRLLITLECLCVLPLTLFDWLGRKYNRQGIHIIEADFVSMTKINELSTPLRLNGQASEKQRRSLSDKSREYRKKAFRSTLRGNFNETSRHTFELLQFVRQLEEECQSLFPMTRHMLTSVGSAAYNSITYAKQSEGRTVFLSKMFVISHLSCVRASVDIDKKAQRCHALGAGIIENDVPYIPFEEAWRAHCSCSEGTVSA